MPEAGSPSSRKDHHGSCRRRQVPENEGSGQLQRYLAARRCRLRSLRQRQDRPQGQRRQVPGRRRHPAQFRQPESHVPASGTGLPSPALNAPGSMPTTTSSPTAICCHRRRRISGPAGATSVARSRIRASVSPSSRTRMTRHCCTDGACDRRIGASASRSSRRSFRESPSRSRITAAGSAASR